VKAEGTADPATVGLLEAHARRDRLWAHLLGGEAPVALAALHLACHARAILRRRLREQLAAAGHLAG